MAEELGLDADRIKKGLKSNNKEISEAVKKAYAYVQGKGKRKK